MADATLFHPKFQFLQLTVILFFFFAATLIPYVGMIFIITLPMLLFTLCVMNSPKNVLIASLVALGIFLNLLLFFTNNALPAPAIAAAAFSGIVLSFIAQKNYSVETIIIAPALILLGAMAVYLLFGAMQAQVSPQVFLKQYISEAIELNMKFYDRLPLPPEEITAMKESKPDIIALFMRIFPALCIVASVLTIWGNAIWGNKILYKAGKALPRLSALALWRAPERLVWIFLAAGGLSFMNHQTLRYVGINILLIASLAYFLQGLAITSFFFQTKNISPIFRRFFYFFIAVQHILMIAIAAVGLADIWVDFRKYLRKPPSTD